MDAPLILSPQLDEAAFALLDGLRRAHFPPGRNFIHAHVTLFHALPGREEPAIRRTLADVCAETPPLALRLPQPRSTGRGVLDDLSALDAAGGPSRGPSALGLPGRPVGATGTFPFIGGAHVLQ